MLETSLEAHTAIQSRAYTLREQVYDFLKSRGQLGATDEEIQLALRMSGSTERPRRIELETEGKVVLGGLTRPTQSGRRAVVWVAR